MLNGSGTAALVLCGLVLSGCAGRIPPVPVIADDADRPLLTGTWTGTYEMSSGSRRSGSIIFELQAERDSATGTVVMFYDNSERLPVTLRQEQRHMHAIQSAALSISFVRLAGAGVSGELSDYTDPYCGCRLKTTFTGMVRGDVIVGSFVTIHLDNGYTDRGKWKVARER